MTSPSQSGASELPLQDGLPGLARRLHHTDWLYHRLTVHGEPARVAALQWAAAGAGLIPWVIDFDSYEERLFHRLIAGPRQKRSISVGGARILAGQLREASERRQRVALSQAAHGRACPLDLQRLAPVPEDVLASGPDDPRSDAWLWEHWGTTEALRHVSANQDSLPPGDWALTFWSADWTPWRAIDQIRHDWPDLRIDVQPLYR